MSTLGFVFPSNPTPDQINSLNSYLNQTYGNPDVPTSPLYGGGSSGQGIAVINNEGIPTFSTTVTANADTDNGASLLGGLPDPLLSLPTQTVSTGGQPTATGCAWYDLSCVYQNSGLAAQQDTSNVSAGAPASMTTNPASSYLSGLFGNTFAGFSWGRIGAFMLGLILIGGGLYLFGSGDANKIVGTAVRAATA
jgi:hypothetical protein